jgi:hypothetical protein
VGPFQAEYFNNRSLSGAPALVRTDPAVDFNWGWGQPAPGINRDNFSVRWTGAFAFEDGTYRFRTYTDDGIRVYVDDRLVINAWYPMRGARVGYLAPGRGTHTVRVEYFERTQVARAHVTWSGTGSAVSPRPPTKPPTTPSYCEGGPLRLEAWPTETRCVSGGWAAKVFANGRGGDCRYTYYWERQTMAGPTGGAATFELWSPVFGAMVGEVKVSSGGQSATVDLYIRPPTSCK